MLWAAQGFFRSPYDDLLPSKKTGYSRGPQNEVRKSAQKLRCEGPPHLAHGPVSALFCDRACSCCWMGAHAQEGSGGAKLNASRSEGK